MSKDLVKPLRDDLLIEYLTPESMTASGLHIPESAQRISKSYTMGRVLAKGPDVYDVDVGAVVFIDGHRSGIELKNKKYLVSQKLLFAERIYEETNDEV